VHHQPCNDDSNNNHDDDDDDDDVTIQLVFEIVYRAGVDDICW